MRETFRLGDRRIRSSASIGVAIGSAAYAQAEEVLRDADAAMYRAKALGKARTAVFEKSSGPEDLEADLRAALSKGELRILYMPIIDVSSGRVEGLEALARWQHPRLGLVAPSSFLALAERTGLIISIDRFMLETASRQLRDFRRDVPTARHTSMSINVSQKLLEQEGLANHVDDVLRASRLEPRDLSFDISEGAAAEPMVLELHQRGLRVHMDDFGKGQSWLRHLHEDALDSVKIDRSFVNATAGADRAVLRHMVSIARELGKSVIAEGVETAEQLKMVRDVGCDAAQGFFFGAPLDAAEARTLLESGTVCP
jgi:EAL domain-containing protein (putative c-di-GMP-specific phosphodiesterase class I)